MAKRRRSDRSKAPVAQQLLSALEIQRAESRAQAERWLDTASELESLADWYVHLFEASPIAYAVLDPKGVIIQLNPAAAELLQVAPERECGKPFFAHVYRDDAKLFFHHLRRSERGNASTELRLRHRAGELRPVRLISRRWHTGGQGQSARDGYYYTAICDITEDRRRDELLRLSEARHREIVETANEGICIVNDANQITFANHRLAAMLGRSVEDLIGCSAYDLIASAEAADARRAFDQRDTGAGGQSEQCLRRRDGTPLRTSVSTTIMRDDRGRFTGMLRMYTDATMRQYVEEARETLMREMVAAQERERQRIARELHDQMGQHIVALSLGPARLAQMSDLGDATQIVAQLRAVADLLGRDVHTLALELRPAALDHLGLGVALISYAEGLAARSDVEIDVHCDRIDDLNITATVQTGVYRIAQEALTNVLKHAQAKRVSVILEVRPGVLQLIVEDDGVGFDVAARLPSKLGLMGMKERAALLGGTITIESARGRGTTVYARIPIPQVESYEHEQAPTAAFGR
jgi:PAS domain S-box-containing protein